MKTLYDIRTTEDPSNNTEQNCRTQNVKLK